MCALCSERKAKEEAARKKYQALEEKFNQTALKLAMAVEQLRMAEDQKNMCVAEAVAKVEAKATQEATLRFREGIAYGKELFKEIRGMA